MYMYWDFLVCEVTKSLKKLWKCRLRQNINIEAFTPFCNTNMHTLWPMPCQLSVWGKNSKYSADDMVKMANTVNVHVWPLYNATIWRYQGMPNSGSEKWRIFVYLLADPVEVQPTYTPCPSSIFFVSMQFLLFCCFFFEGGTGNRRTPFPQFPGYVTSPFWVLNPLLVITVS